MKTKVRFFAHLRDLVGGKAIVQLDLEEGATISHLLDELLLDSDIRRALLDENQEIKSEITILKNGREIKFLAGLKTLLDHGDVVSIFPVVVGG